MRTTLQIDDDILNAARSLARAEERTLGEVISEWARRGLSPSADSLSDEDGFPVFSVAPGTSPLTLEMVQRASESDS